MTTDPGTDRLTGLPGRWLFARQSGQAGEAAGFLVGVDGMGRINHRHGYRAGDRFLHHAAEQLWAVLPPEARLGRHGGDLFIVHAPDSEEPAGVAGRLKRAIEAAAIAENLGQVSASVGYATGPATCWAERVEQVEVALAQAKLAGGDTAVGWSPEMTAPRDLVDPLSGLLTGDWGTDCRNISLVLETLEASNAMLAADTIFTRVLDWMIELSGTDRGLLLTRERGELRCQTARSRDRRPLEGSIPHSESVVQRVVATGLSIALAEEETINWEEAPSVKALGLHAVLCVPIRARRTTTVLGVVYLDGERTTAFSPGDLRLFEALARQLCPVLERARLQREVDRLNAQLRQELDDAVAELDHMRQQFDLQHQYEEIVGRSPAMRRVLAQLDRVADTDLPVLIQGETGTGKELVARALHRNGPRAARPFLAENCAAIPENLLESELFGHAAGAFSGAVTDKRGLLHRADRGTLFLDEIGEMPLELQSKLLRVLQDGCFRPVGSESEQRVDVRIVSATNRDLEAAVQAGLFRADLMYRINVISLEVPPLRERTDDLPALVDHFVNLHSSALGVPRPPVTSEAMKRLLAHDWPGNIRELSNLLQRAVVLCDGAIEPEDLQLKDGGSGPAPQVAPGTPLAEMERALILRTLDHCKWNRAAAAKLLDLPRTSLRNKIRQHGLSPPV